MPIRLKVLANVAGFNKHWAKSAATPIEDEVRNGVKAWVDYLQKKLPTYTDTVRGTLVPAARVARTIIPSRGNKAPWKKDFTWRGSSYPLGFSQASQYADAKLVTRVISNNVQVTFTYNNMLPYFIWNNLQAPPPWLHLPSNPPWHALEAAAIVFNNYVRTQIPGRLALTLGQLTVKVAVLKAY